MKYLKIKLVSLLFLLIATVSCDDYVDIEPQGFAVPVSAAELDLVLENVSELNLFSFGTFTYLLTDDAGWSFPFQEFYIQENASGDFSEINLFRFLPEHVEQGQSDRHYEQIYSAIGQTNFVLNFIDQIEATDNERNRIKAEALAVRAFSYYMAVNTYGLPYTPATADDENSGVPIVNSFFGDIEQPLSRGTLNEVYDVIIADLLEAIDLFPADFVSDTFRMSKVGAYATLAKTYLSMGQYALAGEAADEALTIKNNLLDYNTDLEEGVFFDFGCFCVLGNGKFEEPSNIVNPEIIFNRGNGSPPGFFNQATFEFVSSTILSDDLQTMYDQVNDFRYSRRTSDGPFGRVLNESGETYNGIRVSEVWLIKAEAEARTGDFSSAMSIINDLRANRFDATIVAADGHVLVAANQAEAIQHVLDERRRELIFTPSRLIDIRRLNALEGANISATHEVGDGVTETLPANDNKWTFAIPSNIIGLSDGQIIQNPR